MESVLQNSIISTSNYSQNTNPSTARLLINHIKRLVEEDMKLTVEAFNYIENKIDFEHLPKASIREDNTINVPIRNCSNRKVQIQMSQHSTSSSNQFKSSFQKFIDQQKFSEAAPTSTSLSSSTVEDVLYNEQEIPAVQKSYNKLSNTWNGTISDNRSNIATAPNELYNTWDGISSVNRSNIDPTQKYYKAWNGTSSDNRFNIVSDNTSELDLDMTTFDENIDGDIVSLSKIRNMYSHFTDELDRIFNRISQRFQQDPNLRIQNERNPALQTIAGRIYDGHPPTWTYNTGNSTPISAQPSFVRPNKKQIRLPQLIITGNERIQDGRKESAIHSERVDFETDPTTDSGPDFYRKTDASPQTTHSAHVNFETDPTTFVLDSYRRTDVSPQTTDSEHVNFETDPTFDFVPDCYLKTDASSQTSDDPPESTDNSPQTTDSLQPTDNSPQEIDGSPQVTDNLPQENDNRNQVVNKSPEKNATSTVEGTDKNAEGPEKTNTRIDPCNGRSLSSVKSNERTSEPGASKTKNDVIISDIGSGISSDLLATPITNRKEWQSDEELDLDKIASIIKEASPNRRVIIKKKLPEVAIKGYNKICNEKLIFSGYKITHVKRERKTMSRNISLEQ